MAKPYALYNEIDHYCATWLRSLIWRGYIADGEVAECSLADLTPKFVNSFTQFHTCAGIGLWSAALRGAGIPDSRPLWTASLPCQPFSAAGKGDGFADERHLWPEFFHLVEQCRPPVVLGEQVASKDGLAWFDLVQSDLEGTGYAAAAIDSCSAGFGAPHIRQRLYWCAKLLDPAADTRHDDTRRHDGGSPLQPARFVEHGASEQLADAHDAGSQRRDQFDRGRPTECAARPGGVAVGLTHPDNHGCETRCGLPARPYDTGIPLTQQVPLASWPTTRSSDAEKNVLSLEGSLAEIDRKGSPQDLCMAAVLSGPARLTASGQILTGYSAETASGDQLNPEHSRWLMACPVQWAQAAPNFNDWQAWQDLMQSLSPEQKNIALGRSGATVTPST